MTWTTSSSASELQIKGQLASMYSQRNSKFFNEVQLTPTFMNELQIFARKVVCFDAAADFIFGLFSQKRDFNDRTISKKSSKFGKSPKKFSCTSWLSYKIWGFLAISSHCYQKKFELYGSFNHFCMSVVLKWSVFGIALRLRELGNLMRIQIVGVKCYSTQSNQSCNHFSV